jgi:glycosyltransferase involved in cell wall biosynthesis
MNKKPRILFLYTEIANYFLSCVKELHKTADIAIVRWAVNKEAPFAFEFHPEWQVFERSQFVSKELLEFSEDFNPDIIVCSGWIDEGYNAVAKHWKDKIPTVISIDNHYTGSIRQQIGRLISKFKLHNRFSHAWVPGNPQEIFAKKLGFSESNILKGFYSADVDHFNAIYSSILPEKRKKFPRRFIYVGRYVDFKGITELWAAFINANSRQIQEKKWELWCVGTGEMWDDRIQAEGIKHFGFLQTKEFEAILKNSGVFVLPSRKEPWGVVVHEMACAGLPLLCSDKIGAASAFLEDGKNGFYFKSGDAKSLESAMHIIMNKSDKELMRMGEESHSKAMKINPVEWSKTILSLLKK